MLFLKSRQCSPLKSHKPVDHRRTAYTRTRNVNAAMLNSAGLVSNMAGVVLAFYFGFPQPDHSESVSVSLSSATVLRDGRRIADIEAAARRKKAQYRVMSCLALGLMLLGFSAQATAFWFYSWRRRIVADDLFGKRLIWSFEIKKTLLMLYGPLIVLMLTMALGPEWIVHAIFIA